MRRYKNSSCAIQWLDMFHIPKKKRSDIGVYQFNVEIRLRGSIDQKSKWCCTHVKWLALQLETHQTIYLEWVK